MPKLAVFVVILFVFLAGLFWLIPKNSTGPGDSTSPEIVSDAREVGVNGPYTEYNQLSFEQSADKKRVLFFHAPWCPTCKVANAEFDSRASEIPDGVILFKVDYDSETELKKRYNITYQHTFVLLDGGGTEIKK